MAQALYTTDSSVSLITRLKNFVARNKQANADWAKYRQTLVELQRLSNRELADIGVGRNDIDDIAHEHVFPK